MITNTGPHVTRILTSAADQWCRVAPIVKALDDPFPLTIARDDAYRVFRAFFQFQDLDASPGSVANTILGRLKGYRHPRLYAEMYVGINPADAERHASLLAEVQKLLKQEGILTAGPSWYDGNGTLDLMTTYFGFVDAWATQGYWGNTPTGTPWAQYEPRPWHALRYRQLFPIDGRPVFITESGRDAIAEEGTAGQAGWLKQGCSQEEYLAEIEAADAVYRQDGAYATLYSLGTYDVPDDPANQGPFDTTSLAGYLSKVTVQTPTPGPSPKPPRPTPPASGLRLLGFDFSSRQGRVDLAEAQACGRHFALIKASESNWYTNPQFADHWERAGQLGLLRGAYLYAQPGECSPAEHVTLFEKVLGGTLQPGDLIALDLEEGSGDLAQWAAETLDLMGRVFEREPLLYTGESFARPHNLWHDGVCGRWPLWLADYDRQEPSIPFHWRLRFWQFTDHGRVPGVQGESLEDVYVGEGPL